MDADCRVTISPPYSRMAGRRGDVRRQVLLDSMRYRESPSTLPAITSGVKIVDAPFSFNRSIRIGSRQDRITGDSGALTGRELLRRSTVVRVSGEGTAGRGGTGAGSGILRGGWRGRWCCWRGRAAGTTATRRSCGTIRRCGWPPATGRARLRWAGPGACPRSRRCRGGWLRGRRRRASRCCARGCSASRGGA